MDIEQLIEAAHRFAEAWNELGLKLSEAANAINEAFKAIFSAPEIYPESNGTPPKKYGMSLRRCPRRTSVHYNYIPRAPRNLPYMRRAY